MASKIDISSFKKYGLIRDGTIVTFNGKNSIKKLSQFSKGEVIHFRLTRLIRNGGDSEVWEAEAVGPETEDLKRGRMVSALDLTGASLPTSAGSDEPKFIFKIFHSAEPFDTEIFAVKDLQTRGLDKFAARKLPLSVSEVPVSYPVFTGGYVNHIYPVREMAIYEWLGDSYHDLSFSTYFSPPEFPTTNEVSDAVVKFLSDIFVVDLLFFDAGRVPGDPKNGNYTRLGSDTYRIDLCRSEVLEPQSFRQLISHTLMNACGMVASLLRIDDTSMASPALLANELQTKKVLLDSPTATLLAQIYREAISPNPNLEWVATIAIHERDSRCLPWPNRASPIFEFVIDPFYETFETADSSSVAPLRHYATVQQLSLNVQLRPVPLKLNQCPVITHFIATTKAPSAGPELTVFRNLTHTPIHALAPIDGDVDHAARSVPPKYATPSIPFQAVDSKNRSSSHQAQPLLEQQSPVTETPRRGRPLASSEDSDSIIKQALKKLPSEKLATMFEKSILLRYTGDTPDEAKSLLYNNNGVVGKAFGDFLNLSTKFQLNLKHGRTQVRLALEKAATGAVEDVIRTLKVRHPQIGQYDDTRVVMALNDALKQSESLKIGPSVTEEK